MPNGKKQSVSKLTGAGKASRKNLTMKTTWRNLNVTKSHRKGTGRNS